ncbi:MAG: hypothetical protein V1756_01500 [Patescibacteria group bacterium]
MEKYLSFHFANPFARGLIGDAVLTLVTQVLIVGGFVLAAYFIIRYLKRFYGDRPVPKEWNIFWLAVVWGTVHEVWEMAMIYRWITGLTVKPIFLVIQVIAGVYLIVGSYLLAKKNIAK